MEVFFSQYLTSIFKNKRHNPQTVSLRHDESGAWSVLFIQPFTKQVAMLWVTVATVGVLLGKFFP